MRKRTFKTEELDRIGRKLLDAGKMRRDEIERIVSSPTLFEAVKARIEIERRERDSQSAFGGWMSVLTLTRQLTAAAVALIFAVGAAGIIGFNKFAVRQQSDRAAAPKTLPEIEQIENPPFSPTSQTSEDFPTIEKIKKNAVESRKISKQNALADRRTQARKPARRRQHPPEREKPLGKFYALAAAGNSAENGEQLRVVRTELSRSSLFALGVNISIENGSENFTTDLLVGADGVARAIRFVN